MVTDIMSFFEREKERITPLRPKLFTAQACSSFNDDIHLGKTYETENLYLGIRTDVLGFFKSRSIAGHRDPWDSQILSSQNFCVNFFFPFISASDKLKDCLNPVFGNVQEILPISAELALHDGSYPYVTFEWIGTRNYLGEPGKRVRGKYVTNIDALVRYKTTENRIRLVLIEWKYTEQYMNAKSKLFSPRGTDRFKIYQQFLNDRDCPIRLPSAIPYLVLFQDPFDQLMRHQLLAREMEKHSEMDADEAVVLLIAPQANQEFIEALGSPYLKKLGNTIPEVWSKIVIEKTLKYVYTEDLLPVFLANAPDQQWADYMRLRYTW